MGDGGSLGWAHSVFLSSRAVVGPDAHCPTHLSPPPPPPSLLPPSFFSANVPCRDRAVPCRAVPCRARAVPVPCRATRNIMTTQQPMEERYRRVKVSNPAFARRLGDVPGGRDLVLSAGFVFEDENDGGDGGGGGGGGSSLVLVPSAEAWPRLVGARDEVGRLLSSSSVASAVGPSSVPPPLGGAGVDAAAAMRGLLSGNGRLGPNEASMMREMLADPNALRSMAGMMSNPVVQNMMRNDPRMSGNPMMQQALRALESDPGMVERMMSDPDLANIAGGAPGRGAAGNGNAGGGGADPFASGPGGMRAQMEAFERLSRTHGGNSGGFNVGGGGGGGGAPPVATARPSSNGVAGGGNAGAATTAGGNGDGGMTEEDMIAEAIARSLREM